jgi:hypothetical protein
VALGPDRRGGLFVFVVRVMAGETIGEDEKEVLGVERDARDDAIETESGRSA